MSLAYTDEETMLAEVVQSFCVTELSFDRVSAMRTANAGSLDVRLWKQISELGLLGIDFDESNGGVALGMPSLAIVGEAFGATLAPTPMLSTVLLGGQILQRAGNSFQRETWLPRVIEGDAILSLAHFEPGMRFETGAIKARATAMEDGFCISGTKSMALDATFADAIIVSAVIEDETDRPSLFLVSPLTSGVTIREQRLIDGRPSAVVEFQNVKVSAEDIIGERGAALALLNSITDHAILYLCAEMIGGMQRAFDMTVDYLGTREQFNVKIGTFQALQHRAARMFTSLSLARPTVRAAALAADGDSLAFARLVSHAKAMCCDAYLHIANEAIQMHGGIGMTEEFPVGHYLKAARVSEMLFGDAAFHRGRWAQLHDY